MSTRDRLGTRVGPMRLAWTGGRVGVVIVSFLHSAPASQADRIGASTWAMSGTLTRLSLQVCFTDAARVAEWAVCHSDGFIVGALGDGDTCAHHVKLVLKAEIHG